MRITNSQPNGQQTTAQTAEADIEADFWSELQAIEATNNREMAEIEAESMGWTELAPGTYLHIANEQTTVFDIVGIAAGSMSPDNVLWLL
jgi:hypothetical protein